jgi:hypothetical protein
MPHNNHTERKICGQTAAERRLRKMQNMDRSKEFCLVLLAAVAMMTLKTKLKKQVRKV